MLAVDDPDLASKKYAEVQHNLDANKSLPWQLCMDTLQIAYAQLASPETQQFLDDNLLRVIALITQQSPSKLGAYERNVIDDSIVIIINMLLKTLPHKPYHLHILAKVFDSTNPYYSGTRGNFNFVSSGFPAVRIQAIKRFAEGGGYLILLDLLRDEQFVWPGGDVLLVILKTLNMIEVLGGLNEENKVAFVTVIKQRMLGLPEEQLRRENSETLGHLVAVVMWLSKHLAQMGAPHHLADYRTFCFDFTLKVMNSGSLVLRLYAWEQLNDLITEARHSRPLVSSYFVSGAGTDFVNGEYKIVPKPGSSHAGAADDHVYSYTKAANPPHVPLLTLFRCTMRTKAKWWFISQADLEKPGTDKDIDYYLHKSGPDDEREPPPRGWTRLNTTVQLRGLDPAPTIKRGNLILGKNTAREAYFDYQLLELCARNKLLEQVFGASIHREVVARSGRLLSLLAEYDRLGAEELQAIWKAAMQNTETDIVDEVYAVLVQAAPALSDELFAVLMNLARDSLRQPEHFVKVAQFLDKFAIDNFKPIASLASGAGQQLRSLVWDVFRDVHFDHLKNAGVIQDLLSCCLSQKEGAQSVVEHILDCKRQLTEYAELAPGAVPEAVASRLVRALFFLVSKHTGASMVEQLQREDLATCLVIELGRYVTSNGPKLGSAALDEATYASHLTDRLDIVRKFYSIHPHMTLPMETLRSLSELLSERSVEQEVFFTFLRHCCKMVIAVRDSLEVFTSLICAANVDWSKCGEESFECFKSYFCELEGRYADFPVGTELPPRLGLDTLWRIALHVGSSTATHGAIELLLQAYESILFLDEGAYFDLLRVTFSYLENAIATAVIEEGRGPFSPESQLCISRCMNILSTALAKSKGHADPAHAVRGNMHRMQITVYYRRVTAYYNAAAQTDMLRSEKGSEGSVHLEVHPLHTVKELKDRIIELAHLGSVSITLDHPNRDIISNTSRLHELDLFDGGELSVTYQSSFSVKSYEDDLYSDTVIGVGTTKFTHIGQLLASNFAMFDTLLTLCEMCKDPSVAKDIWQLIMLIPTQVDMVQQSVDQACALVSSGDGASWAWSEVLQGASAARTAYMLQIIDSVLQPATELLSPAVIARSLEFREASVKTNGFSAVLRILIDTPAVDNSVVNSTTLSVALHIVHFMLFESIEYGQGEQKDGLDASAASLDALEQSRDAVSGVSAELLEQVEAVSAQVIEKLLHVARGAAAEQASDVVHNALLVITKLIKSPEAASQLTSNPQSELLLTTVLRSDSKKVREMAAEFAVKVGSTQPVVLNWLLCQLETMQPSDRNCTEIFSALTTLLGSLHFAATLHGEKTIDGCAQLAGILSDKLTNYPRKKDPSIEDPQVLLGYLNTLNVLIGLDAEAVTATPLGTHLVESFLSEFLFAMPTEDRDDLSICDTQATRQAAFSALSSFLAISPEGFDTVLAELNSLAKLAARRMNNSWGLQVSHDVRKSDLKFTGLKNQGCTCYLNSLLQVLFMSQAFREAVLATPLRDIHRVSLWHKSDVEIVGNTYLFEYMSGMWRPGLVVGFDPVTSRHRVQYTKNDGSSEEIATFNIHEGRFQRETGRVRVIPPEGEEPLSEREESAYRVLDQLQRTFCFMKHSKKRFFDPVEFVEACKALNLNFNVYHQNDAAEFWDQLLDRIETATKGRHTKLDVWNDIFLKSVFGGRWLYQKIPRDCDIYATNKEGCGHWQSSRLESFLKVELMIRGKERIEDSLEEAIQGELMDGDNKIHCEVCLQKKATVRRTCFGDLPTTLMLHLKRFDLDFQTFETVKLNNRMAFPQRINLLKYTKEGIEADEKRKQAEQEEGRDGGAGSGAGVEIQYEVDGVAVDPSDYEYELQGILVHAGVAQGGHYYSFIRDSAGEEWFRFDDDEVTAFDPAHIPAQCFGGPPSYTSHSTSSSNLADEDRTANALMLLYNKVKQPIIDLGSASAASSPDKQGGGMMTSPTSRGSDKEKEPGGQAPVLVDGTQAYKREVMESNLQHILTCYLLDPDLHVFVRGMLASITQASASGAESRKVLDDIATLTGTMKQLTVMKWSPQSVPDDLPLRTVQFGVTFLLDVVLHCRERAAIRTYVQVMKETFEAYPHTAKWFLGHVLDSSVCQWFADFTLHCSDSLARGTFVQIVVAAAAVIAPTERKALAVFKGTRVTDMKAQAANGDAPVIVALLVRLALDHTFKSVGYTRTADDLFALIRDLAAIPSVCDNFLQLGMVSFLSFFIIPETVPPVVRNLFEKHLPTPKQQAGARLEYSQLHQSVFDAIAALLGVPQIRKVPLLQDRAYWGYELVPEAQSALSTIFKESSRNHGMDSADMVKYFERVTFGGAGKPAPQYLRSIVDRFHTLADGRLSLQGFLEYHTELASSNPKLVWRDLHAFGFKNNLSRVSSRPGASPVSPSHGSTEEGAGAASPAASPTDGNSDGPPELLEPLQLAENCRSCLAQLAFYEAGMITNEAAARSIAKRVCHNDLPLSNSLIHQGLAKLLSVASDSCWNNVPINAVSEFLQMLLSIGDGLQRERLTEILLHPRHGLAIVIWHEKTRPSNCRANDRDKYALYCRYVDIAQELLSVTGVLEGINSLAAEDAKVQAMRGSLRLNIGMHNLTEDEVVLVRDVVVRVSGAGVPEVNGDYTFRDIRNSAGYYVMPSIYRGHDVTFTLYKCTLKNGGFQWFISITPPGKEPGTSEDIDFYYSLAKAQDKMPPVNWIRMNPDPNRYSRDPAPTVQFIRPDHDTAATTPAVPSVGDGVNSNNLSELVSSDSEHESFMMVDDDRGVDDSFASSASHGRYYE